MTKRTILLFGAGAAIAWGGPTTKELTTLTRQFAKSFKTKSGVPVTEFIYESLKKTGLKDGEINFETIISVIDDMLAYHAYFDGSRKLTSISKCFFDPSFGADFWDYSVSGKEEHGYHLEIPAGTVHPFSKPALNNENPTQFYFQHLLNVVLTNINFRIGEYTFRRKGNVLEGPHADLNRNFIGWIQTLNKTSLIRTYTLNYDRNFKILKEHAIGEVFEGFNAPGNPTGQNESVLLLDRILIDFENPVHYNLHGSVYWNVHHRDAQNKVPNPSITLSRSVVSPANNDESSVIQADRGRSVVLSGIITGYQKTTKSMLTPFRQMQAAFDRDCMSADELFVVGYSFGDYHINSCIVNSLRANPKVRLHIIDPAYSESNNAKGYDLLVDRLINIFPDILKNLRTEPIYSNDRLTCTYFNNKLKVTTLPFDKYLAQVSEGNII